MKCLEAAAGKPSRAEQIRGGGRLAVNYTAVLPGNLRPGAGPQAHVKPRAKASSLGSGCGEAIPRPALLSANTGSWGGPGAAGPEHQQKLCLSQGTGSMPEARL